MPFPSNTGSTPRNLSDVWDQARAATTQIKSRASELVQLAAGNVSASIVLSFITTFRSSQITLGQVASVPGIAEYAQQQLNAPTRDIVAEFNAMNSALDTVVSTMISTFPKDGAGYLLKEKFKGDGSGNTDIRTFAPAELAGLVTLLNALLATID